MTRRRPLAVVAAVLLAHAACASTSYKPRADGRITMGMDWGRTLVKDGKDYPADANGLSQVVAGNPTAEEYARRHNRGLNLFLAEYLVGLGACIAGFALLSNPDDMGGQQPLSQGRYAGGLALNFGGLALLIISGFQVAKAQAHFMDAINVYNDDVVPRPHPSPVMMPTPPAPPPQVGAPEVIPLPVAPPAPAPSGSPAP